MNLVLSDNNYYSEINKSPLSKLQQNIKSLIDNWKSKGVFDTDDSFSYVSRAEIEQTNLARAYALVKIHKNGNPIRIIVSAIGSSTYTLDKSLSLLFNRYFLRPTPTIKSCSELKKITDELIIVPDGFELSSFDVVSLFSNIPSDLILQALTKNGSSSKTKAIYPKWNF